MVNFEVKYLLDKIRHDENNIMYQNLENGITEVKRKIKD